MKGLSVAFAAAMAVTAFAPATVSEAASTKTYVVSKKVSENGEVTKYTYDKRGRVVKEVITQSGSNTYNSVGTDNNGNEIRTATDAGTIDIQVRVGDNIITETIQNLTTYSNEVWTYATNYKDETTWTYTYYNSGKNKDQVKSAKATRVITENVKRSSTNADSPNNYGYSRARAIETTKEYTYNSKGQCVKTTKSDIAPLDGSWSYILYSEKVEGTLANQIRYSRSYLDETYTRVYPLSLDEATQVLKNEYKPDLYGNVKTVETVNNTYNSKGNLSKEEKSIVTDTESVTFNGNDVDTITDKVQENGTVLDDADYWTSRVYTYNKNGQATKVVYNYDNKFKTWTMTTKDKNVTTSMANTIDGTDSVLTSTFTYGKDLQLAKSVQEAVGLGGMTTASLETLVYGTGGTLQSVTYAQNTADLNKYKFTTTYSSNVKSGSIALTSSVASIKTEVNGGESEAFSTQGISYTLKKISVPSSRTTAVMQDTFKTQFLDLAELPLNTIKNIL